MALAHILKPGQLSPLDDARRQLSKLQASVPPLVPTECLVLSGDPAEEIVRLAGSRHANLIVMGLHSSGLLGPRMGSVTYRVLSTTDAFVLALPPHVAVPVVHPAIMQGAMA